MPYENIESGLLTLIQSISGYSSSNSSRGDYRVLASGPAKAVVIWPGSIPNRELVATAPRRFSTTWEIYLDMFIQYQGDGPSTLDEIIPRRQELLDRLDQYPTLNGVAGVIHSLIIGAREPEVFPTANRNWWMQRFILRVTERTTAPMAE